MLQISTTIPVRDQDDVKISAVLFETELFYWREIFPTKHVAP